MKNFIIIFYVNLKHIYNESTIIKEIIIKRGKQSQEEVNLLQKYVNKFDEGNWSKIKKFFI